MVCRITKNGSMMFETPEKRACVQNWSFMGEDLGERLVEAVAETIAEVEGASEPGSD
jgi:ATP-dependent RNA circularization protein (DNA/RNA ligase family)